MMSKVSTSQLKKYLHFLGGEGGNTPNVLQGSFLLLLNVCMEKFPLCLLCFASNYFVKTIANFCNHRTKEAVLIILLRFIVSE